jgi:hypothetical protein
MAVHMTLNPYQQNALDAELRHLETTLLQIQQSLRHPPPNGLLTHYLPISEMQRLQLEKIIEAMLAEIAILVREFALQPRAESVGRWIDAEMAAAWVDLYESLSPKLNRYGDVAPALATTLDPHLRQLIGLAQALGTAARTEEPEKSPPA